MNTYQEVILVDHNDQAIGTAEKLFAHQQGLLHRAFSIFILRHTEQDTELLLQQRQFNKYHSSGLWTNTCCSHPNPGEDLLSAGERRLFEEMGLTLPLQLIGNFHYTANFSNGLIENELDHVLLGFWQGEEIKLNVDEVANCQWLNVVEVQQQIKTTPQKFTPWFGQALDLVVKKINSSQDIL